MQARLSIQTLLSEAMKEQMKKTPLEKITVQMILDSCNVSRPTFYNYFRDKYDLINWIFKTSIEQIANSSLPKTPWPILLGAILDYMKNEQAFYTNALNYQGQNSFREYFYEYIYASYFKGISRMLNSEVLSEEMLFSIEFYSYASTAMICRWIESNMPEDPYQLAELIVYNTECQTLNQYRPEVIL